MQPAGLAGKKNLRRFYYKKNISPRGAWYLIPGYEITPPQVTRTWSYLGSRYEQERPAQNFMQSVCRQFQPCKSAQTSPTPDLTQTPTLAPKPLGGSRSAGAVTRIRRVFEVFPQKKPGGRETPPAMTNTIRTLDKKLCRPLLHIQRGRVSYRELQLERQKNLSTDRCAPLAW